MADIVDMVAFVRRIANLTKDGELDTEGNVFVMENDDAYNTLHVLISDARDLIDD